MTEFEKLTEVIKKCGDRMSSELMERKQQLLLHSASILSNELDDKIIEELYVKTLIVNMFNSFNVEKHIHEITSDFYRCSDDEIISKVSEIYEYLYNYNGNILDVLKDTFVGILKSENYPSLNYLIQGVLDNVQKALMKKINTRLIDELRVIVDNEKTSLVDMTLGNESDVLDSLFYKRKLSTLFDNDMFINYDDDLENLYMTLKMLTNMLNFDGILLDDLYLKYKSSNKNNITTKCDKESFISRYYFSNY